MSESKRRRPEDPLPEVEEIEAGTAARLREGRPTPSESFGEDLWSLLTDPEPRRSVPAVGTVRSQIAGSLALGTILLALAAVGVAGAGPFAS